MVMNVAMWMGDMSAWAGWQEESGGSRCTSFAVYLRI